MSLDVCPSCSAFVTGHKVCPVCGYGRGVTTHHSLAVVLSYLVLASVIAGGAFIALSHSPWLTGFPLLQSFHLR